MSLKVPSLDRLVTELSKLPGVGEKTSMRLAFFILKADQSYNLKLQNALNDILENIKECPTCFSYMEGDGECSICQDDKRDVHQICVVEEPSDITRIETSGAFNGKYHVLQGAISPLDGVQPEDLKIRELVARIEAAKESGRPITEVIMALDADLEGDTTALYISRLLGGRVRLTRIAHGVPFGSDIDYIDRRTLGRALENRVEM
ncbi:MAG: recombination protein RecR [Bdellovibrionales bacterium]|nr:recombination protein RecR [Bdellovibrionales bacterium]